VGGIALVNQITELISFLQNNLGQLPALIDRLTNTRIVFGPFNFDFSYIDWNQIGNQLLTTIEPILSRLGTIFGSIATGAFGFIGSLLLSLFISFLIITETQEAGEQMIKINIPGYQMDLEWLGSKIGKIWNRFLRGQTLVFLFRFILYLIILSIFRLKYVLGMALLATLGNFIPYIGVAIVWIINFFIALLQGSTAFGLNPFPYALILMGVGWISDNLYDTFFTPKNMGGVLKLHPAAVLVAVLVGLKLFGILGMFLAPPTLATLRILGNYVSKKLQDKDPWENEWEPVNDTDSLTFFGKVLVDAKEKLSTFRKDNRESHENKDKEE
jgi:predicted PurR-regulated permease PerM